MALIEPEKTLLLAIHARVQAATAVLAAPEERRPPFRTRAYAEVIVACQDRMVRLDYPGLVGKPLRPGRLKALRTALKSLDEKGLVERIFGFTGARARAVAITPAGERLAVDLRADSAVVATKSRPPRSET